MYQGPQSIKDFWHNTGTVYCRNGASTNGLKNTKNDHTNVTHEKGAGQPSTAIIEDNIERARDMVLLYRRVTIDEVAYVLQISHGSTYELIHNKFVFHEVCAKWVPKHLTEVHKQTRVDICQKQLDRYGNEPDIFLDRIIAGDETCVHHYEPECKRRSMEWNHPQSA